MPGLGRLARGAPPLRTRWGAPPTRWYDPPSSPLTEVVRIPAFPDSTADGHRSDERIERQRERDARDAVEHQAQSIESEKPSGDAAQSGQVPTPSTPATLLRPRSFEDIVNSTLEILVRPGHRRSDIRCTCSRRPVQAGFGRDRDPAPGCRPRRSNTSSDLVFRGTAPSTGPLAGAVIQIRARVDPPCGAAREAATRRPHPHQPAA